MLLVMACQGLADAAGSAEVWQPASVWDHPPVSEIGNRRVPQNYNPVLITMGRMVYADLQSARQAALNRNAMLLRIDLQQVREALHRLQMPPKMMALEAQLTVIENDLKDRSKGLDADLWVPIEAEIDDVLTYVPDDMKAGTRQAIHKARRAAGRGDRAAVSRQLDVVTSSLEYSLVMFPLHKVWLDIRNAEDSANLPRPDWTGALEAIQRAMASIRWYTKVPIHGLLTAYNAVINAYVLQTGPNFRPDQQQQVLDYLSQAEHELSTTDSAQQPGTNKLVSELRTLIDTAAPRKQDIRLLLDQIQSQIHYLWQQADNSYWQTITTIDQPVQRKK